jgi:two-component system response regulator LytT
MSEDRDRLKVLIREYMDSNGMKAEIYETSSAEELFMKYGEELGDFGIIFLDIFMDGMSGMDAAKKIRETGNDVRLVFLTSSSDFAVESYDVEAAGYLLKPTDREKFSRLMSRISAGRTKQLIIFNSNEVHEIDFENILFAESSGHQSIIHAAGGMCIKCWKKLDEVERQLEGDERFLRCTQSFIVNMDRVRSMKEMIIMEDGTEVPVRRNDKREIRDRYFRYIIKNTGKRDEQT